MSRSYKHFPLFRDQLWGKSMKRGKQLFNRKLRRKYKDVSKDLPNGNYYRKVNNNYELYEYKHHQTLKDTINEWESNQKERANCVEKFTRFCYYNPTLEEAIQDWKSSYLRK